jgi:hypothetical protein
MQCKRMDCCWDVEEGRVELLCVLQRATRYIDGKIDPVNRFAVVRSQFTADGAVKAASLSRMYAVFDREVARAPPGIAFEGDGCARHRLRLPPAASLSVGCDILTQPQRAACEQWTRDSAEAPP